MTWDSVSKNKLCKVFLGIRQKPKTKSIREGKSLCNPNIQIAVQGTPNKKDFVQKTSFL
jgi:hypothetical protein